MRSIEERNKLVVEYKHLADKIAKKRKSGCVRGIQLSELKSAAYMGLIDAATKFDETKGVFAMYARYRIHGEINDFLRKYSGSRKRHRITSWSLDVPTYSINFHQSSPISENLIAKDDGISRVDNDDSYKKIMKHLTPIQQKIIYSYYVLGLSMKEIGSKIGVCDSRISQIASEARDIIKNVYADSQHDIFDVSSPRSIHFFRTNQSFFKESSVNV
jgi:RNA polymerase sigma factor (sigma-70 family)